MRKSELDIERILSEDVTIPENVLKAKENALKQISEEKASKGKRHQPKKLNMVQAAAAVLLFVIVAGGTTFAATTYNRYVEYKKIQAGEVSKIYDQANAGGELLFVSNRVYSEDEQKRYGELYNAYKKSEAHPER